MTYEQACDPRFEALLHDSRVRSFTRGRLRDSPDSVVGAWPDLSIAYFNPAWVRFAWDNGGDGKFTEQWALGRDLLDAVPEVLRAHYRAAYEQCLETGEPWSEDYECSSAARYRAFRSTAYPLGRSQGLLIVHTMRLERPHERAAADPDVERFASDEGWLTQCAYCRRFAEAAEPKRWVWVPDWVRRPPGQVTHGICEPCADHYFGFVRRRSRIA